MKASTTLSSLVASAVLAAAVFTPNTSEAAMSQKNLESCKSLQNQLTKKIKRLKRLASERASIGDNYGARRLRSTANVIAAHRGNLPCVNQQTCGI